MTPCPQGAAGTLLATPDPACQRCCSRVQPICQQRRVLHTLTFPPHHAHTHTHSRPRSWRNLAYPSLRPLGSWLVNLLARVQQLVEWTGDLGVPKVVWLSGLFNPQSFLTAVMQTTARRNDWPLDKTVLLTEVRGGGGGGGAVA